MYGHLQRQGTPGRIESGCGALEIVERALRCAPEGYGDYLDSSMMHLSLDTAGHPGPTILCLGSHSDDIEIGCGGTLLHLAQRHPGSVFHWVVFSAIGARENEARLGAELFAGKSNLRSTHLKQFSDGLLP